MTSLLVALTLTSLKIEAPQFQTPPKLMPVDLPAVPKVDVQLQATTKDADLTSRTPVESSTMKATPVKLEEVQLSKSFVSTSRGLRALEPVDTFVVTSTPAQLPSFKACVRVGSPDRMPTRVRVQVKLPGGAELTSASKMVWFEQEAMDVVFDFAALKISHAGAYKVVVSLDGSPVADLPLEVRSIKQAAEESGR